MPFADLVANFGSVLVRILAVLGGVLAGAVLFDLAARLASRMLARKPPPKPAQTLLRAIGGILGGLLVAWFVFSGPGGWGLGPGTGLGGDQPTADPGPTNPKPPEPPKPEPPKPEPKPAPSDEAVQVTVLGGSFPEFKEKRCYRVEPRHDALTLAEVQDLVRKRRAAGGAPLKRVDILIYANSVAKIDPAVRDLENWVQAEGLDPAVRDVAGPIPP